MDHTFHRFSDLPWELRDMIWNLALRPAVPGVHIFKVYNKNKDDGADKNIDVSDFTYDACLAAPKSKKSPASITRNRNNPSTYLIDGGMWTACKESRLVMERNFQSRKWKSFRAENRERLWHMSRKEMLNIAVTAYFTHRNGDAHFFTVFPLEDLIILRPQNPQTIEWDSLDWATNIGSDHGWLGFQNIAFEFDPEWKVDGAMFKNLIEMVIGCSVNIWIVDYSLRRIHSEDVGKPCKPAYPGKKSVSFHLNGHRLIEVTSDSYVDSN